METETTPKMVLKRGGQIVTRTQDEFWKLSSRCEVCGGPTQSGPEHLYEAMPEIDKRHPTLVCARCGYFIGEVAFVN